MTIGEAMAKVIVVLDEVYADALANAVDMIKRHNPTREEFESFMQWYRDELEADRAKHLSEVRGWLSRGGEPLQ